jgi:hypothetical protein
MSDPASPSPSDLERLRAAAEKATPGPWEITKVNVGYVNEEWELTGPTVRTPNGLATPVVIGTPWEPNARFIALANPATVLALLDRLEAVERARDELADMFEPIAKYDLHGVGRRDTLARIAELRKAGGS